MTVGEGGEKGIKSTVGKGKGDRQCFSVTEMASDGLGGALWLTQFHRSANTCPIPSFPFHPTVKNCLISDVAIHPFSHLFFLVPCGC